MSRLAEIVRRPRTWAVVGMLILVNLLAVLLLPEEMSAYAIIVISLTGAVLIG
ncbi:hypothetical protein [Nonomuraea sp. WAC 01424]|uniref:hypothetical protein n=1 Tax=Nonomuraea sp. WAC 01424 TaxID=2203200 RepID=UPI00163BD192|nr:hypothetical protein [Nonomuraea sp. WAC 01424]